MSNPYYKDYADFLAEHFEGKVQKITINAGFTCPNRDGLLGRGGCSYCNNRSFSPGDTSGIKSVTEQIAIGKKFFVRKYPHMRYLAYFQSYTNTYGDINDVMALYDEALDDDELDGVIIGTRPDCMPNALLSKLADLNRHKTVIVEYGAESSHDETLKAVNRCHTWATTVDAVQRTKAAGILTGLHFILGLPGETTEMMLKTVDRLSQLPVDTVKFHQLQIVKGTRLAADYLAGDPEIKVFDVDEYIDLCVQVLSRLRKDIAVERFVSQSPDGLLIAPAWGLKNYEFTHKLLSRLGQMA